MEPKAKRTHYFSFGQTHAHSVAGFTYDKDVIVEIEAENPRDVMFETFGDKWGFEYISKPNMSFFPRGIKKLK